MTTIPNLAANHSTNCAKGNSLSQASYHSSFSHMSTKQPYFVTMLHDCCCPCLVALRCPMFGTVSHLVIWPVTHLPSPVSTKHCDHLVQCCCHILRPSIIYHTHRDIASVFQNCHPYLRPHKMQFHETDHSMSQHCSNLIRMSHTPYVCGILYLSVCRSGTTTRAASH
jgi:hypothetical protein